jgi:very-short-patch-repair endonuclease/DNA-directed RNA polymerase subunit RPC12/RpoP
MNTWDEKNYTKPKSNCLNNNEQEPSDTTKITKSDSMQPQWIDIGGVKKWIRNCPECGSEILYAKPKYQKVCEKRGSRCKDCQNKEISKQRKGVPLVKRLGRKKALEMKRKQSLALKGVPKPKFWTENMKGENNPNYGNKWNKKQKQKARSRMAKMIAERGWTHRNYNPDACYYLDDLSKKMGWNLIHAKNGGEQIINGYFVDGFDDKNKIIVEYDEPSHYYVNGNLKKNDIDRMNEIIQYTGYKFYRYSEKTKEFYEYKSNFNSTTIV